MRTMPASRDPVQQPHAGKGAQDQAKPQITVNKHPRLIAVYSFRHDADLVPDMLKNLDFVDDAIGSDERGRTEPWYHEGQTKQTMIQRAIESGADWILGIDPDERFEKDAGSKIRRIIRTDRKVIFSFRFRELWTPTSFRSDGIWGKKERASLFPVKDGQTFHNLPIHSPWHPTNSDYRIRRTQINLYHLKMIRPQSRIDRRDLYKSLDPDQAMQSIGYDYLTDESGLELTEIGQRRFYPEYRA